MQVPYRAVLSGSAVLFILQATAYCGLKQSNYDKERDKRMEEQHKELQQLQVQKLKDEAREKRDKQQDEVRKKYREDHLLRHPTQFYNARIMGRYGMKDGKPVLFVPIEGQIQEVLGEQRILVAIPVRQVDGSAGRSPTLVLVILEKSQILSKGQKFSIPNVVETGTYSYSRPDGAQVPVKIYTELPGITLKEFMQLRKDGYKFAEEAAE
ncbi:MAG: hypothetical protein A2283_08015 [Lentisphaerae bacterium RIFOXYA12_FULL_48_11]|nr:MAG: hypothetical protein A2283_08015 [Lentisphaerae bacterium RIFOXYA12_FULL_48_11]